MSIELVMPSNHLVLCHLLLLLPSIFPSIRVFSNESDLHIRWPKYWSFSFNISLSNEHSELISFRIDWLDLLAVGPGQTVMSPEGIILVHGSEPACPSADMLYTGINQGYLIIHRLSSPLAGTGYASRPTAREL